MTTYGFSNEDDFRRMRDVVRRIEAERRGQPPARARWQGGAESAFIACTTEDWTAFGTVEVQPKDSDGDMGDPIDVMAPGVDGTDMTGTKGICIPVTGFNLPYQFIPLECEPTCDLG